MEARFSVTGKERKKLVEAIEQIVRMKAVYKKAPTFEYVVNNFTIDRNGTVRCQDEAALERLVHNLIGDGFTPEETAEETTDSEPKADRSVGLKVTLPLERAEVGNLMSLLEAKGDLIRKALGIEDLRFSVDEENISFPWFGEVAPDEALTYTKFIAALCDMSRNQKRITAKPKENENEKYAFRCFLLRLGFIGDEYKADRKILLSRLDGSSAFKSGAKKGGEQ